MENLDTRKIIVLDERQKVRDKISVWLGSNTNYIHVIKELIGNSIDEISKNIGSCINITMLDDRTIVFEDDCQGLPVETIASDGSKGYEALFNTLFAGTKYDKASETVGTNGVFLTVLTFSSEFIKYEIGRPDGNIYSISYKNGLLDEDFKIIGCTSKTFTRITFRLDDQVYLNPTFNYDDIYEICKLQASLFDGKIELSHMLNKKNKTFIYENGISELLTNLTQEQKILFTPVRFKESIEQYEVLNTVVQDGKVYDRINVDLVFTFNNDGELFQYEFLNTSHLINYGTIQLGIFDGFKSAIHKYIKDNNMYKKDEKQISLDDVKVCLSYICNFKSRLAEFENQTKFKTLVPYYRTIMFNMISREMEIWFLENKIDGDKLANQILVNKRVREKSEVARTNLKKKLEEKFNFTNNIKDFYPCRSENPKERALFITEGKSALSAVVLARNKFFHACIPVRGKVLNCLKASLKEINDNPIIIDLMRLIGVGIDIKDKLFNDLPCNYDNLQYDKIVFACDSDVDGGSIRCLLLAMIYKLAPKLLIDGHVYIAEAPLFEIEDKDGNMHFAYNDEQMYEIKNKLGNNIKKIGRSKGLTKRPSPHHLFHLSVG